MPAYRGRCPLNWVLVNGETHTGVSLHYMTPRPDDGDIVAQKQIEISDDDTAHTLHQKIEPAASMILEQSLPDIQAGTVSRKPQDPSKSSYFGGHKPEDSIKELAEILVKKFDMPPLRNNFSPFARMKVVESKTYYGKGYKNVQYRKPSIKNALRYLGWNPSIPLGQSVEETLDFFLHQIVKQQSIEPISKVCCCSSGESWNPVFSVLFWTSAFAG
ncbi:MAG: hypothetical protein C0403_11300, partial [Desulfobacterium sp.]|nr:hypothetical protein [Desulfobacterium sp.]